MDIDLQQSETEFAPDPFDHFAVSERGGKGAQYTHRDMSFSIRAVRLLW